MEELGWEVEEETDADVDGDESEPCPCEPAFDDDDDDLAFASELTTFVGASPGFIEAAGDLWIRASLKIFSRSGSDIMPSISNAVSHLYGSVKCLVNTSAAWRPVWQSCSL